MTVKEKLIDLVVAMRKRSRSRSKRRAFMQPSEFRRLRRAVLRVTQDALSEQMIHPGSGEHVAISTICRWEIGSNAIPLWAARRIKALATAARTTDQRD